MRIEFELNGEAVAVDAPADASLLSVLRRRCGVLSVRETCGIGVCGACTALVDGVPISTCILLAPLAAGTEILTGEGLADDDPVVAAFAHEHAFQCGFCTPGFVLTARQLLSENRDPTTDEIRAALAGNLCRCGSYENIVSAVRRAASAARADAVRENPD